MAYKDNFDTEEIRGKAREMLDFADDLEEFGHVAVPPDEEERVERDRKRLMELLQECEELTDSMGDHMETCYSY